ncbi:MAG: PocR ligand-binding domain-containing protein, partial [Methanospirillum sp.]|nr:PocR ligand-binding domain-containing protein [Methanospirillum sp.]
MMSFSELVDITQLQELCQSFTDITGAATAILDLDGTILSATGWRDICTRFHRVHPETAKRCLESDTILAGRLRERSDYSLYKCRNGIYDAAVPIMINDTHVANFFSGQFFLEKPDLEYFRRQAEEFGFDTPEYLKALSEIPVYSSGQVIAIMDFFSRLARIMGEMGLNRRQLEDINAELKRHQEHLVDLVRERTSDLNKAEEIARIGSWKWDLATGHFTWS